MADSSKAFREAIQKELTSLISTKIGLDVGANGFESSAEDYRISASFEAKHGVFPNEIAFSTKNEVQLGSTGFSDQVSGLRIGYDRNLGDNPQDEAFAFLERFGARPIGLDARYELGAGIKTEYFTQVKATYAPLMGKLRKRVKLTSFGTEVFDALLENDFPYEVPKGVDRDDLIHAVEEKHAMFKLGASVAAFLELQRSTIVAPLFTDSTRTNRLGTNVSIPLRGRQVIRLSFRPAITIRPGSRLRLRGEYFWKPAISGGAKKAREDGVVKAEWAPLSRDRQPTFKVTCEWNTYYDHEPERIDLGTLRTLERGRQFVPTDAAGERRYTTFKISMGTEFNL